MTFFSHHPILHQSLQHTNFSPPFTQLNSLRSSFCALFTNFPHKISFCRPLYAMFTPKFFLCPPPWLRPAAQIGGALLYCCNLLDFHCRSLYLPMGRNGFENSRLQQPCQ